LDKYNLSINSKYLIFETNFIFEKMDKNSSVKERGILYKSIGLWHKKNGKNELQNFIDFNNSFKINNSSSLYFLSFSKL
jgi:hypothetical protein